MKSDVKSDVSRYEWIGFKKRRRTVKGEVVEMIEFELLKCLYLYII